MERKHRHTELNCLLHTRTRLSFRTTEELSPVNITLGTLFLSVHPSVDITLLTQSTVKCFLPVHWLLTEIVWQCSHPAHGKGFPF